MGYSDLLQASGGGGGNQNVGGICYGFTPTLPPTAGWSWINQASAAVDTSVALLDFTIPINSGDRMYVRTPANAAPYTVYLGITQWAAAADFWNYGLIQRKSSGGAFVGIMAARNALWRWNDNGSVTDVSPVMPLAGVPLLMKLTNDGSTIRGYVSPWCNPNLWVEFDNGGKAAAGFDQIGIFLWKSNSSGLGSADQVRVWHWLEVAGIA